MGSSQDTTRRVAAAAAEWLREGRRVVRALLIEVDGSAPLAVGSSMLVDDHDRIEGSITGGCIEGAVVEQAREIFAGGSPRQVTYGVSDELAGTVGLSCGGMVHLFVHELRGGAAATELRAATAIESCEPVAVATLVNGECAGAKLALVGGEALGSLGVTPLLDSSVRRDAAGLLAQGASSMRHYGSDGSTLGADLAVHVATYAPRPRMFIVGAIDFSAALARIARDVGYHVTICDPRRAFAESTRFAVADEVCIAWPQDVLGELELGPRDAVLVFSHDPKFDVPAVRAGFATGAGYVGALGSRRTTADRLRRLLDDGCGEEELAALHAPCGLDLGGSTPEEVAISVMAEIVAVRTGRSGAPLADGRGPIHAAPDVSAPRVTERR